MFFLSAKNSTNFLQTPYRPPFPLASFFTGALYQHSAYNDQTLNSAV
jgi:hypothetical protein